MAFSPLPSITLAIATLLLLHGSADAALNFTEILDRGGQYTTFLRFLNDTQVGSQLQNQLNGTHDGFTVFAPTDNAFSGLGPINNLTQQQQVALLQFHIIPKRYTFNDFQTASNPIHTQGGGDGYNLNITAISNTQVNVSTGVNTVTVTNALNTTSPLAIYEIGEVLKPLALFGKTTTAKTPVGSTNSTAPVSSAGVPTPAVRSPAGNGGFKARSAGWGSVVGVGLVSIGMVLL